MKLDLQKDERKIRSYIEKRIKNYSGSKNQGPGDGSDPIMMITLGYYLEQSGWFALVFDTREDADCDGEWTSYIDDDVNVLQFPKWQAAFEHLCNEGTVTVTLPNGTTHTLDTSDDNESVARLFGEMLRDTMLGLRDAGEFVSLPLAPKAFFGVEEFDGHYGWPTYKSRKTLGRLRR